jgi:hypothetical protein
MPVDIQQQPVRESSEISALGCPVAAHVLSLQRAQD